MFLNNAFEILNKDTVAGSFVIEKSPLGVSAFLTEDQGLPLWFGDITDWLENRQAPKHRKSIAGLLAEIGCRDIDGFARVTHALSLNDTLWVREAGSPLSWDEVSLYRNPFDETIARIAFEGGLYGRQFSSTSPEFTTEGAYQKCWIRQGEEILLCKGGGEGVGEPGLEPYSEMYAAQVAKAFGVRHVPYEAGMYRGRLVSFCPLFSDEETGFLPAYKVLPDLRNVGAMLQYFEEHDAGEDFRRMIVLDALIINTDRHAGNYGVLFNTETFEIQGMAPLFDHNMALLPFAQEEDFREENIGKYLSERPVRIGNDFNEIAHALLTPAIKADLQNLNGFRFDRETEYALPEWRLKALEGIVNTQIKNILQDKHLYIPGPAAPEMIVSDAAWELSGCGEARYLLAAAVPDGIECTLLAADFSVLEQDVFEGLLPHEAGRQFLSGLGYRAELSCEKDFEKLLQKMQKKSGEGR